MSTASEFDGAARAIGEAIPAAARRLGWGASEFSVTLANDEYTGDPYEQWSIRLSGPVFVGSLVMRTMGDRTPTWTPVIKGGTLGYLYAPTADRLLKDVRYWVSEMHLADIS